MQYIQSLFRRTPLFRVFTILLTGLVVSGCLVDGGDSGTVYTPVDGSLHIYQANDYIVYDVNGQRSSGPSSLGVPISGTLRIEWNAHADLVNPLDPTGPRIEVLEEVTTLTIGSTITESKRYISQDPDGTMYLHAFEKDLSEYYWVNTDLNPTAPPLSLNKATLLDSPLTFDASVTDRKFNLFGSCNTSLLCNDLIGSQSETSTIQNGLVRIQLQRGIFDTYRMNIAGEKVHSVSSLNTTVFPIVVDFRSSCNEKDADFTSSSNFYPSIGIIYQVASCASRDGSLRGFTYYIEYSYSGGSIQLS